MWKMIKKEDTDAVTRMEMFVSAHEKGHFMQTPRWSEVKTFWGWRGILVYQQERIVAAMSVLIRPLPLGLSLLYAPRGPVCDRNDRGIWNELMEAVKELARQHRAILLYLDPDEPDSNEEFRGILTALGFWEKTDDGFGNIQAQHVFRLSLKASGPEDIYRGFSAKTRYNIHLATRRGVTLREYSGGETIPESVLGHFSALMEATGQRDHFRVRGKSYFQGLLKALQDDARLLIAFYENEPIAGAIEVFCGKKAWYLYGASANVHRNKMPNYLLQWTMIRRAVERGCEMYDLRGVPGNPTRDDPLYGLYRFKKGFGGTDTKFTGLFIYCFRPTLGRLFLKLQELRRKINKILPS